MSDACEEQFDIIVDLGGSSDCRTRVASVDLLFDGDCRWNTFNIVYLWFIVTAKELSGVGIETFDISSLSFGVESVEGERGLAGTADSGDDDKFVAWNLDVNAFEVVDACVFDLYFLSLIVVGHDVVRVYCAKIGIKNEK